MTFTDWLYQQIHEETPIGDLARDASEDSDWWHHNGSRQELENYIVGQGGSQWAVEALNAAYAQWESETNVSEINVSDIELGETQAALLELVQEGTVFATSERERGRVTFVAAQHATDEDREFTRGWLENPHFGTQ